MWRTTRNSRVVAVVVLLSLQGIPAAAAPPIPPEQVTYQGVLLDGQGAPQTGNVDLAVRIYDAGVGGTLVYLQDFPAVPLADGVFTVVLGPTGEGTDLNQTGWSAQRRRRVGVGVASALTAAVILLLLRCGPDDDDDRPDAGKWRLSETAGPPGKQDRQRGRRQQNDRRQVVGQT